MMLPSIICASFFFIYSVTADVSCNYRYSSKVNLLGQCIRPSECRKTFPELGVLYPCHDPEAQNEGLICCPKTHEEIQEPEISCTYQWNDSDAPGLCVKPASCKNSLSDGGLLYSCHDRVSKSQGLICCPKYPQ